MILRNDARVTFKQLQLYTEKKLSLWENHFHITGQSDG